MTTSLQTTIEQPLTFSTRAVQSDAIGEADLAVLVSEVSLIDSGSAPVAATIMAVATDTAADADGTRAQQAIDRFQAAVIEGTQTDMAARLKFAFRSANAEVFAGGPAEVSMVAMVARGKYASVATVGDASAFLYRADRINQVTRNQKTERTSGRRSDQRTLDAQAAPQFLGIQERLDSRLPAIFDLTLLPLDSVALVGGPIADQLTDSSAVNALVVPGQSFSLAIEKSVGAAEPGSAAAILEVLPAREAMPAPPPEAVTTPTYLPYVIIAVVMLLGLLLAIWYFFL